ncbi:MAG: carboxylesterase family protein, partial [Deltaproteobacteria bacterium]|nr:carboxylesterase family protein [Deltaproteobacteria bacterium]
MRPLALVILAGAGMLAAMSPTRALYASDNPPLIAETKFGPVVGAAQGNLAVFKGIPYAASTEGEGRFAPPKDPVPWTEPRSALDFGPACWQQTSDQNPFALHSSSALSDDCLSLNIWAPKEAKPGSDLPVYVFIHGGGFGLGAGSQTLYDGAALASEGLIVVTLNYRLGAYGFLAPGSETNSLGAVGNWGILDQIKALEWVQANIKAFGGDPG